MPWLVGRIGCLRRQPDGSSAARAASRGSAVGQAVLSFFWSMKWAAISQSVGANTSKTEAIWAY